MFSWIVNNYALLVNNYGLFLLANDLVGYILAHESIMYNAIGHERNKV